MGDMLKAIEDYYIIFTESGSENWLIKRLRKPYQHVLAIKKSPGKRFWIVINPIISFTYVDIVPVKDFPDIESLVDKNAVIVPYTASIIDKSRHTLCVINCVEIVKSLLGIRAFWIWTPYQLYKYIKKGGDNG